MKGELFNVNFCETEKKKAKAIQEESIVLHFSVSEAADLAEMTEDEISVFFSDGIRDSFVMGKASKILSNIYNLTINGHVFKGEKFTSCEVNRAKQIGEIIILRCRIPYDEKFHDEFPGFIRSMIDIEIESVGQMSMDDQKKKEEE